MIRHCAESGLARIVASTFIAFAIAGCTSLPEISQGVHDIPGVPVERDLRALYRATVCRQAGLDVADCEHVLLREAGEMPVEAARDAATDLPQRYRIGLVPGFFAECLAPIVKPFEDVEPALREQGFAVAYFDVPGRGTAVGNARYLAERLAQNSGDARPYILVSYSKGLADVLELLVNHPDAASKVAAVVSIAGAANGSPLADSLQSVYTDWIAGMPMPWCRSSTGEEILDLRRDLRREWWERNGDRLGVPVFSLVATPREDRLSFGMQLTHRKLAEIDSRNDGKILWYDQLVPGGYLLGFANADHWVIAVPLADDLPALSFLFRDGLPRRALVQGAIEVVADFLERHR